MEPKEMFEKGAALDGDWTTIKGLSVMFKVDQSDLLNQVAAA